MKILVTGANGFIAHHLIDHILKEQGTQVEVFGTMRRYPAKGERRWAASAVALLEMDLTDAHAVNKVMRDVLPDRVFHLAGESQVSRSWDSSTTAINVNGLGTLNVLNAMHENGLDDSYVQVAGSSEEYGLVGAEEIPIREDIQPLRPLSPYAVSKIAADMFGHQFARSYGMNILRTRTFNQTGPGRGEQYVDSGFARQVALIEAGLKAPVIDHGNLEAVRDFTDVRDTVRAYWILSCLRWEGEVINVCSGRGRRIADALAGIVKMSTRSDIVLRADPSRQRPSDVPVSVGSVEKLHRAIAWAPVIPYERSLSDMLEYWRDAISDGARA
ncbi:MAG: GDP-mannose 4,6-dehydratase [Methanomassiliicoccales archaeon]